MRYTSCKSLIQFRIWTYKSCNITFWNVRNVKAYDKYVIVWRCSLQSLGWLFTVFISHCYIVIRVCFLFKYFCIMLIVKYCNSMLCFENKQIIALVYVLLRTLFHSRKPRVYLKASSWRKSSLIKVILLAVLEWVHMHNYCLKVNLACCFLNLSAWCKYLINPWKPSQV